MDGHYRLKNNTHSSCIVDSVKGDILKVYYPPCECGDEFGSGCSYIHKSKLGEKIEGDINLHQIDWLCEKKTDLENLYNLRVDKVMELEAEVEELKQRVAVGQGASTPAGEEDWEDWEKIQGRLSYLEDKGVMSNDEASDILSKWMDDNDLEFNDDFEVVKKDNTTDNKENTK